MSNIEMFKIIAQAHKSLTHEKNNIETALQHIEFDLDHLRDAAMSLLLKDQNINEFNDLRRYTADEIYKMFGPWARGWMRRESLTIDQENIKCKIMFFFKEMDRMVSKEIIRVEITNEMTQNDEDVIKLDVN